jgi:hypothetical protein
MHGRSIVINKKSFFIVEILIEDSHLLWPIEELLDDHSGPQRYKSI